MKQNNNSVYFVNKSRNVVWLTGYARRGTEGDELLLYQSANPDRAIPVTLPKNIARRPADNQAVEIQCHAYGYMDEQGAQRLRLQAVRIKRPSVSSIPSRYLWSSALESEPFTSLDDLRKQLRTKLELTDLAVEAILLDSRKNAMTGGGFMNLAIVTGFIGSRAFIPPQTDGSMGYLAMRLLQHPDEKAALPIRITTSDRAHSQLLRPLMPVNVNGEIYVEVEKDAEGTIIRRNLSIRADKHKVGQATAGDFAKSQYPEWWKDALNAHHEQKQQAAQAATQSALRAVAAKPAEPSQQAQPEVAGIIETDEEF